jgi:hypothetical protein
MATAGQRHHEHPCAAHAALLGIEELTRVAKVDLSFLAGGDLQAEGGTRRGGDVPAQEALHRGVAASEAVLLDEQLPDRLALDPPLMQREDTLAKGLNPGLLMQGPFSRRGPQETGQRRRIGQRAAGHDPMARGPHAVAGHGVAADVEVAGDAPVRLAQLQSSQDLADLGHRIPPSRHVSSPGTGVLRGGWPVVGRTRKESGHARPARSSWPPLGGSRWVTLPGSVWATLGGSASPTPVAHL